jgi:hypothetical protein
MIRGANGGHIIPDVPKGAPQCEICKDTGVLNIDDLMRFCLCPAGELRKIANPQECVEANAALDALNRRVGRR